LLTNFDEFFYLRAVGRKVLWSSACVCVSVCLCALVAGGRAVSEPYYSQRVRSVCISLSAFFITQLRCVT